jgi:peptidoglycan/LPS O-acetylase OafA/YrhL
MDKVNVPQSRLHALDALRGCAAIGVALFYHMRYLTGDLTMRRPDLAPFGGLLGAHWLYTHGDGLVDLFFVLSGYIFCHVYRQNAAPLHTPVSTYAINRVARLYPLHLLTLFIAGGLIIAATLQDGSSYGAFIATPIEFFLQIFMLKIGVVLGSFNAPAWSISVEFLCYALFYVVGRQRQTLFVAMSIVFVTIGLLLQQNWVLLPFRDCWFPRGLVGFFSGALLFNFSSYVRRVPILVLALAFIAGLDLSVTNPPVLHHIAFFARLSLLSWIPLLARVVRPAVQKLANNPVAKFLGDHSFSIYLWHVPIAMTILLIHKQIAFQSGQLPFLMSCETVIILVVAALSLRLIERPAQGWLRSRHSSWRERRVAQSAW